VDFNLSKSLTKEARQGSRAQLASVSIVAGVSRGLYRFGAGGKRFAGSWNRPENVDEGKHCPIGGPCAFFGSVDCGPDPDGGDSDPEDDSQGSKNFQRLFISGSGFPNGPFSLVREPLLFAWHKPSGLQLAANEDERCPNYGSEKNGGHGEQHEAADGGFARTENRKNAYGTRCYEERHKQEEDYESALLQRGQEVRRVLGCGEQDAGIIAGEMWYRKRGNELLYLRVERLCTGWIRRVTRQAKSKTICGVAAFQKR